MNRHTTQHIVLVAALAAAFSFSVTDASADNNQIKIEIPGDGQGWAHDPGRPLLTVSRMMPGSVASTTFGVLNDSPYKTKLSISSADVRDNDNGCNAPEAQVDTTCGAGQGELGRQLVFSLYLDKTKTRSFVATPVWSGSVRDLAHPVTIAAEMPAHAAWNVKLEVDFPRSSGNETQGDVLDFTLRIGTTGLPVQVLGEKIKRGGALPFTGAELALLAIAGAIAAALGATILRVADKRASHRT